MNERQKMLLSIYIPFTVMILVFGVNYPYSESVQYTRYIVMVTLALSTAVTTKRTKEQKLMALSFLFLIIGDFSLVALTTIYDLSASLAVIGILGFTLSYACLIPAYQKRFKFGKGELFSGIAVAAASSAVYVDLLPYLSGIMVPMALVFGAILSYMVWTAISTVFRGYFARKMSWTIAISAVLMYICDIGIAYSLLHPYYSSVYIAWLKNIVWVAYILGWTLLAIVINEESLYQE